MKNISFLLCFVGLDWLQRGFWGLYPVELKVPNIKIRQIYEKSQLLLKHWKLMMKKTITMLLLKQNIRPGFHLRLMGKNIREDINLMRMRGIMQKRMPMTD